MPNDSPASAQNQNQNQQQTLTVNIGNASGDRELEYRIFSEVHSVGRQLGALAGVVEVLIAAHQADPGFAPNPTAREAIAAFERMQADIEREKRRRDPERFIQQLDTLRSEDPQAFSILRARLRDWLDEADSAGAVGG